MDPEVERTIRRMAKTTGKSLNRVILDMIHQYTGLNKKNKNPPAASSREHAGGWSDKDAAEFLDSIKSCEQIDKEMWTLNSDSKRLLLLPMTSGSPHNQWNRERN
jgi:hypothetical protein